MSEFKMPELPEPEVLDSYMSHRTYATVRIEGYTADQIEAYGRLCAQQMREACAAECDRVRSVSAVSYETGATCARAIRSIQVGGEHE